MSIIVFCIVGPNGCGKTTLLDCILGLLQVKAVLLDHQKVLPVYKRPEEDAGQLFGIPV